MDTILKQAKALQEQMVKDRRFLHAHAEVGFELDQTKTYVSKRLSEMGITWQEIGKSGVMALLGSRNKGGATLLRADMDALPIQEQSGETFACEKGRMHACGHDMHTAILLGAARILKERENELETPVKLLFQPAEELLQGAEDCLKSGVLNAPKVIRAAALHVAVGVPLQTGTILIPNEGVSAPAADFFKVTVQGKGCHGSAPQNGVDAALCAAHILIGLEEIVARELPSSVPTVLTVGRLQSGNAANAIAETATLEGTLRTFDEGIRKQVKKRIEEITEGMAISFRARAKTEFFGGCPCLVNDGELCRKLDECVGQVFDERMILRQNKLKSNDLERKSGGSEDFAFIAQNVPSVFFALVAGSIKDGYTEPLHSPRVRFDEDALSYGAAALSAFALYE